MHKPLPRDGLSHFHDPRASLGTVDAEAAARLIAGASDVALVLDRNGMIRDVAFGGEAMSGEGFSGWRGQDWRDTVTVESREKVERLIAEATTDAASPWRQVNHPSQRSGDVPVLYATMRVGDHGPIIAVGRDLRAVADLQKKLVDAQAAMERDYGRLRQTEMRYRLLFQLAAEPVFIVDAATRRITEANPATLDLVGASPADAAGLAIGHIFEPASAARVGEIMAAARASGRAEESGLRLAGSGREVGLSVSLFRQERAAHFLVRIVLPAAPASAPVRSKAQLLGMVENLPDAMVVCDLDRRVLTANGAFLDLVQVPTLEQVRGEALEDWLGRSAVDLNVLVASLREHGSVRHFGTVVRGALGGLEEVEVAAVSVPDGDPPCFGFSIRAVGRRLPTAFGESGRLPESVAQLTELVGRVSMKELVRETTDLIERMCIEAALELTNDNRASAAEMLGLSRQSFYAKLHRFGLGDLGSDEG
ncbi:transcriptional regulator PpsR [Salinarimonas soli]|uniref:Transcriptional regulator PpsR n=1 Tax=Salinarimonas soli TaxID=1638099 RepID=A0A5B2VG38_9HYPH|nr:transcriptional regulator PpsR [Salinarimonas soli]KAA2238091.1 transcriptional regulator PpsR [Salinarimonas soli]